MSQCVKATYFLIGRMARRISVHRPAHLQCWPHHRHSYRKSSSRFAALAIAADRLEVEGGIASVDAALGDPKALSPFFRIPGLARTNAIDNYLASKALVTWSADVVADDWFRHITAKTIVQRAMQRLEAKGRGILTVA